jgi:hypothetical protein
LFDKEFRESASFRPSTKLPASEVIRLCEATLHKLVPEATVPGAFNFADPEDCSTTLGVVRMKPAAFFSVAENTESRRKHCVPN